MSSQSLSQSPVANHGGGVQSSSADPAPGPRMLIGRNAGKLDPTQHPPLPIAQVGAANRSAQKRGLLLGIGAGLVSGFISRRALSLSKNASYLSGLLTAVGVAYTTSAQQLEHNLGVVEGSERGLRGLSSQRSASQDDIYSRSTTDADMLKYDMQAAHQTDHEAGVAGLHGFKDQYATTRGDH